MKKRESGFTLLPSLLHPVLIDTEALKKMSVEAKHVCTEQMYSIHTQTTLMEPLPCH